jgi:uncharacterized membrane protein HdeD (DUF308 family)
MAVAVSSTPGTDEQPGRLWWLPFFGGMLSLVIGIAALVYPEPTLLVVGVLFGGYLAIWSLVTLLRAAAAEGAPTIARVLGVIVGVLGGLAGLVLLVRPEQSVIVAAWALGFWWTLNGVIHLAMAFADPFARIWNAVRGTIGVIAGAIILASPEIGLATLVLIVGVGLIIQGTVEVAAGWELRRLHKAGML